MRFARGIHEVPRYIINVRIHSGKISLSCPYQSKFSSKVKLIIAQLMLAPKTTFSTRHCFVLMTCCSWRSNLLNYQFGCGRVGPTSRPETEVWILKLDRLPHLLQRANQCLYTTGFIEYTPNWICEQQPAPSWKESYRKAASQPVASS